MSYFLEKEINVAVCYLVLICGFVCRSRFAAITASVCLLACSVATEFQLAARSPALHCVKPALQLQHIQPFSSFLIFTPGSSNDFHKGKNPTIVYNISTTRLTFFKLTIFFIYLQTIAKRALCDKSILIF